VNLCVIPARGGSKRIPRKNIKDFLGQPIIAYSIRVALESNLFDKVIVSTDDEEIAAIAREYGAETPFLRPANLSDDYASANEPIKHAIRWCKDKGFSLSYVCCIYATAPLLRVEYLIEAYEKLRNSGKYFAFSVTSFAFPIQRAIRINNKGVSMFYPQYLMTRSQDLEDSYHDAGQFYWGLPEAFLNNLTAFSNKSIPIILPRYLVQDIDSLEDWRRAELLYSAICRNNF